MIKYIVLIGILITGTLFFVNRDVMFPKQLSSGQVVSEIVSENLPKNAEPGFRCGGANCSCKGQSPSCTCTSGTDGYNSWKICSDNNTATTTTKIHATTTKYFSLSVKKQGATKSTISPQDSRTVQYPAYTQIILKANPYAGDSMSTMESKLTGTRANKEYFVGWSGDCSGRGSCSVMMNKNREVTAKFEKR